MTGTSQFLRKNHIHYLCVALLVIVFNLILSARYFITDQPVGDEALYHKMAMNILEDGLMPEKGGYDIGAVMAPGYSFLLAGLFALFGDQVASVFYMNIIFNVLVGLIMFYIADKISNKWIAWGFSVWVLLYYQIWRMNFTSMMEIPTIFLMIVSLYFLFKYHYNQRKVELILFALFAGLLVFLNNRFIFHFALFMGAMLVYAWLVRIYKWKDVFIVGGMMVLVLLPWHIRQFIEYDRAVLFAPARTEVISNSMDGNSEKGHSDKKDAVMTPDKIYTYEEYMKRFESISGMTESRMKRIREGFTNDKYRRMVKNYKEKYDNTYSIYLSRLKGFWDIWQFDFSFGYGGDTRISPPDRLVANLVNIVFLLPMFVFFAFGVYYAFLKKQFYLQLLILIVLAHWVLHAMVHYISRYRITVLPLIFLVAWYGLYELFRDTQLDRKLNKMFSDFSRRNFSGKNIC